MNDVAERAGVTKKTVYNHFRSKDDLIAAWLETLDIEVRRRYAISFGPNDRSFELRIQGLFERLSALARDPRWRGCAFARAANELAGLPGHPGVAAAKAHRRHFETWFEEELRADGLANPAQLARWMIILFDGAVTQSLLHHDPAYALEAGQAAAAMVTAARGEALVPTQPGSSQWRSETRRGNQAEEATRVPSFEHPHRTVLTKTPVL